MHSPCVLGFLHFKTYTWKRKIGNKDSTNKSFPEKKEIPLVNLTFYSQIIMFEMMRGHTRHLENWQECA